MQDFPVAVPAALGGAVVVGFLERGDGTEVWTLWTFAGVFQRNEVVVPWLEAKLSHPVDLHEPVVELGNKKGKMGEKVLNREV